MSCQICTESFNRSNRKCITCPKCDLSSCRICCEKYILSSINEAHCMSCKNEWDKNFMILSFTKKFVNVTYKEFLADLCYNREKAKMEPAHRMLVYYKEADELEKNVIVAINEEIENVTKMIAKLYSDRSTLIQKRRHAKNRVIALKNGSFDDKKEDETTHKFFGHCPNDSCKGLITEKIRCNICNQRVCKSCLDPIGENPDDLKLHSCNKSTLESIRSIKKDSKPCPKCKVYIYKSEGCNQMFCTNCNILFCWRTGEIYKGVYQAHNPHYFEWVENNRVNNAVNPCDDLRNMFYRYTVTYSTYKVSNNIVKSVSDISRSIIWVKDNIIPVIRDNLRNLENDRELTTKKIQYLLNEIDDNALRSYIIRSKFDTERKVEQLNIYDAFVNAIANIYQEIVTVNMSLEKYNIFIERVKSLLKFCNNLFLEYHEKHGLTYSIFLLPKITKQINSDTLTIISMQNRRSKKCTRIRGGTDYSIEELVSMVPNVYSR